MTELKRLNVHRIVDTPEEANKLITVGFKVVGDVVPENPAEETPPEKPTKAK
jgi:hypothetical protein